MIFDGVELLEGSQIINSVINTGASFPVGPNHVPDQGELFYKNDNSDLLGEIGIYVYDGANWVPFASQTFVNDQLNGQVTTIPAGATLPATSSATNGELFYKNSAADTIPIGLYIYSFAAAEWQVVSSSSSHPIISAASSVDNSGVTFVQDLTFDSFGHVTGTASAMVPSASTSQVGLVQLSDSTSTTSSSLAASSTAVKAAYDLAAAALPATGGTLSGSITISTGNHITISDAPVNGTDAVNKIYVDANLAGLSWKQSVKTATTANITLSGTQTIDGVSVIAGDRVLVKDQSTASQNGIYIVAAGAWTRATDFDQASPINEVNSAAVFVEQGSLNADTGWTQINNVSTVGSDAISFTQFNGAVGVTAGIGLSKSGNTLNVNLGAGIAQLPTDEVGVDLYSGGGLMTTSDGTNSDTSTGAQLSLALVGTAGTYKSITTDNFGRVTSGSNPTTLSGFGITDAQPLDDDLTAIAALSGTSGILKKTAANTWSLDTSTYLTGNETITLSGDASGSGSVNISVTLANSGVTAGTYNNSTTAITPITVDAKGRITSTGSAVTITPAFSSLTGKPTTLSGYGITDAQPLDGDLTAIAALGGSAGVLRKTAADTWQLDTSAFVNVVQGTANQVTANTASGTVTIGLAANITGVNTITLGQQPTANMHAVTKQYADTMAMAYAIVFG
jgi:hypothetical protein